MTEGYMTLAENINSVSMNGSDEHTSGRDARNLKSSGAFLPGADPRGSVVGELAD
jgi:hypothetical protein